jgi:hypothetical protein
MPAMPNADEIPMKSACDANDGMRVAVCGWRHADGGMWIEACGQRHADFVQIQRTEQCSGWVAGAQFAPEEGRTDSCGFYVD